ncbi:MAG: hypothetical protein DWH91_05880 [Planctomycetota bacterium]|nr:MAG: hypothetical protein DWH91_05880 [Planctomycetota bacterium]
MTSSTMDSFLGRLTGKQYFLSFFAAIRVFRGWKLRGIRTRYAMRSGSTIRAPGVHGRWPTAA